MFDQKTRATQAFDRMLNRTFWRKLLSIGQDTDLKSFDQINQIVGTGSRHSRGLKVIPVSAIVGSVSDNQNFDDQFNPRRKQSRERWVRVYLAFIHDDQIPPIDVYKVGQAYYIVDGHHRVSVARAIGQHMIEANVMEI
ncbi:MAG: ParB N-terminal domain-containing protein [Chloroflexota bacterium]